MRNVVRAQGCRNRTRSALNSRPSRGRQVPTSIRHLRRLLTKRNGIHRVRKWLRENGIPFSLARAHATSAKQVINLLRNAA